MRAQTFHNEIPYASGTLCFMFPVPITEKAEVPFGTSAFIHSASVSGIILFYSFCTECSDPSKAGPFPG